MAPTAMSDRPLPTTLREIYRYAPCESKHGSPDEGSVIDDQVESVALELISAGGSLAHSPDGARMVSGPRPSQSRVTATDS
jgi:hypothetical protein